MAQIPNPRGRGERRRRAIGTALAAVLATAAAGAVATAGAAQGGPAAASGTHEVATWGGSADRVTGTLAEQTVRDIVHTSIGGSNLRIDVSNAFGSQPITFGHAFVGVQDTGAAVKAGTNRQVTFDGGSASVTIPPGAEVLSDPLPGTFAPRQNLAVSLYLQGPSGNVTGHNLATSTNYLSTAGDHAADESAASFSTTAAHWYFLDDVSVDEPSDVGTVATLGDSITDGAHSTTDTNRRWPDVLASRLGSLNANKQWGVLNEGISGNKLLTDGAGVSAQARLDRDVLSKPGVKTIILLEGINDIGGGNATSPDQVIGAYRQLIGRAHAAGKCIIGATLTPYQGASYYSAAGEVIREAANQFIRQSGEFDGVIDFDKTTRDPDNPNVFLPRYDSGDHLHPNDAGYQAMGDAVKINQLSCSR
jgi:lysophospholipase L1-like esterase